MLSGKHIILGISGGIAAYKSAYLARLLVKAGAEVQVVMTPSAKEFITPLTMSTLTSNPVVSEFFTANTGEWHSHVSLGLWADAMVIAPATASTMGKMAHGIADNMLITTYLSLKPGVKVLLAPAMDLDMMAHPTTAENIGRLKGFGAKEVEPGVGELASGLTGKGRMAEPEEIVAALDKILDNEENKSGKLYGKKVLITAGPTYEMIDPVRFVGNFSTGKMGYALAESARDAGAKVVLISGPTALQTPEGVETRRVVSADEMLEECLKEFDSSDISIMTAAVADYRPKIKAFSKIKREKTTETNLEMVANPDIAATLGKLKKKGNILVGFALETENALVNASKKITSKNLDMIVVNTLEDKGAGFGGDTNKISILYPDKSMVEFDLKPKKEVAVDIINEISRKFK